MAPTATSIPITIHGQVVALLGDGGPGYVTVTVTGAPFTVRSPSADTNPAGVTVQAYVPFASWKVAVRPVEFVNQLSPGESDPAGGERLVSVASVSQSSPLGTPDRTNVTVLV